jgi:hypothetical protein
MKAVNKEWQMCSVGAVFGMGFDTATEAANHAFGRKSLARPMITKDFRAIRTKSLRRKKSLRDHGDAPGRSL